MNRVHFQKNCRVAERLGHLIEIQYESSSKYSHVLVADGECIMKSNSLENRTFRLKRLVFRAVLAGSFGIPIVVISDEIKIEIRPRTDRNVQSDIQKAMEFQQKLQANQDAMGLTELSQTISPSAFEPGTSSSVIIGDSSSVPATVCPPIVIGSVNPAFPTGAEPTPHASASLQRNENMVDAEAQSPPRIPSKAIPFQSDIRDEASGVSVKPRSERLLPPPTMSRIQNWEPDRRIVSQEEARVASASRRWIPVRAQFGLNDAEAAVKPELSSSIVIGGTEGAIRTQVIPTNFQSPSDAFTAPALPPPGLTGPSAPLNSIPSTSQPILPGGVSQSVLPGPPPVTYAPAPINPGAMAPYNPGNLPTYSPRGTTIINGEPFVTPAPCQFDAYYMVEPTVSMQNPGGGGCGPTVGPPYSGIPGSIAPPTVMPNQAPPGIYSPNNSGFRPLLGFGQDNYNVQLGRGIIGQPVAYVPGQPLRNFLRYIFP